MKKQPQHSSKLKAKTTAKTATSQPTVKRKEEKTIGPALFDRFEAFALKRERVLMWVTFGLSILCSFFLFDLKVSIGGDDSAYVERAYNFIHKGVYPYYQGPGYPLVIALLMKVFGFNIPVFKLFSLIFYTAHIVLTWITFRRKIPYIILLLMVGFVVVSDYMQYYASQTWSEAFYMFVQAVVLWLTMKAVALKKPEGTVAEDLKKSWYLWLGIGLAFAFLAMTKTVAIFGITAPVIYFVIQKKYRFAIYIALSFLIFRIGIGQVEKATYGPNTSNQWEQMMMKDAYKKELGTLDAAGFMGRFGENLKTYSSMHFFRFLHIIPQDQYKLSEDATNPNDERQLGWLVTVMVTLLILYSSFRIFKENKEVFFLVLFTLVMCGGIFFGIHASNRQDRLIIILFPFILMIIGYGLYITAKNFRILQVLIAGIFGLVLLSSFYHTLAKTPESIACLQKNLGNEPYYGYTQDWINYLEMGDWCVKNLPEGCLVACRKPTISFITTKKQMWYGVHTIESEDGDYWLKKFKDAGVTHILVADLRAIPHKKTNRIISTMHKVGTFIVQKYPQNPNKLKLVHVVGTEEKAQLFEIMY
jgi:4-amino-4-deoxy-L-arabinose transferase-like glycosyltransferase